MRRSRNDTSRPGQWDFPGGNLDPGEGANESMVREVAEEAGITVTEDMMKPVLTAGEEYAPDDTEPRYLVWILYAGDIPEGADVVTLSDEHEEYVWVEPVELPKTMVHTAHIESVEKLLKDGLWDRPYGANA